jgi:hypothetical protein
MAELVDNSQLALLKKQQQETAKQIKAEVRRLSLERDLDNWRKGTAALKACNDLLAKAGLSRNYSLKKLAALPVYYTLQHTTNKKLKTDDENAKWVRAFISDGGTLDQLKEQANSTRAAAWKKAKGRLEGKRKKKNIDPAVQKLVDSEKARKSSLSGVG